MNTYRFPFVRRFRRSPRLAFTLLAGAGLAFIVLNTVATAQTTGIASSWSRIVDAANKEGSVTFYTSMPNGSSSRLVSGFKKMYPGIQLEVLTANTGVLMGKMDRERGNGVDGGDVVIFTDAAWLAARAKEGKLLKPDGPSLPNWPAAQLTDGSIVEAGREPFVIEYNKNIIATPPRGYLDLLKSDYKGRLGTTELASTVLIVFYDWLEKTQSPDYLTRLKAQDPKFYAGTIPGAQAVASGEVAANVFAVPSAVRPLMEMGAPVDFLTPKPELGTIYLMSAVGWSKRPNAALLFEDYVMSAEGQQWHGLGTSASPLSNIPGSLDFAAVTPADPTAFSAAAAAEYRARWEKILK